MKAMVESCESHADVALKFLANQTADSFEQQLRNSKRPASAKL